MLVRIQRSQIHHYKEAVLDAASNPIGEKDVLQLGIQFPEYPALPTYGLRIDTTNIATKAELKDALMAELLALIDRTRVQIQRDSVVRGYFDEWGWLEFDIPV